MTEKQMILAAVDHAGSSSQEASKEAMQDLLDNGHRCVELFDAEDRKWYRLNVGQLPYMGNKSARLAIDARFVE
jgi:hypothetical protein